jgi:hypothetical protein
MKNISNIWKVNKLWLPIKEEPKKYFDMYMIKKGSPGYKILQILSNSCRIETNGEVYIGLRTSKIHHKLLLKNIDIGDKIENMLEEMQKLHLVVSMEIGRVENNWNKHWFLTIKGNNAYETAKKEGQWTETCPIGKGKEW